MRVVVVTGTDTGVGKTVVTAALALGLRLRGLRVAVVKPAQTGLAEDEPGDLDEVRRLSGIEDVHEFARFPEPLAPATAARRAGMAAPSIREHAMRTAALSGRDVVLVEGAGGLLVELDGNGGTVADLASLLQAPAIVVARAGLGTLNASALTCEALRRRGVPCLGIVIGAWPTSPDLAMRCNVEDLPRYTGVPLLGRLQEGAPALDTAGFQALAKRELADLAGAVMNELPGDVGESEVSDRH
jgi:dethiobiotin synthetase